MLTQPKIQLPDNKALRLGRHSEPGRSYLVTTTTIAREPIFGDWFSASAACRATNDPLIWGDSKLLSWVLMPDHWHGLIQLGESESLANTVRRFKAKTAFKVNRAIGRQGAIWQRGYHDHALRAEENLRAAARYIVGNPLRAGIVDNVGQYPFWDAVWI
jgi:putative transposase